MSWTLVCAGFANGAVCPFEGQYLEWYDPERPATEDMGGWTADRGRAKRFPSMLEALTEWRRVRQFDGGLRPDGEPDRPLTAFNVMAREIPDD